MNSSLCPICQVELPGESREGCPACALSAAVERNEIWKEFFLPDGRARERRKTDGGVIEAIGPYQFDQKIGEGAMGVVWKAVQYFPIEREVAVKLVRQGVGTAGLIERFDAERRSLARMAHDGIVRIFEAGESEGGQSYFVMELVSGTPLTVHCVENGLSLKERLGLFLEVAQAVQHAHQKGVLHRDLKPSNILVTRDAEGMPVPKLIDFGIAKVFAEEGFNATLLTLPGQVVGTPQYMSPEQAAGGDVDTRCDVYGLGAVLYELISGSPPIPTAIVEAASLEEILRTVREFEPERPSVRMALGRSALSQVPGLSGGRGRRWRRDLHEELDWIALRCLEKDPDRRYESVGALADDVRRYLEGSPVSARPPSRLYRARKFIRRNRLLVASMISVAVILAMAATLSMRWAFAADEARELAEKRLAQADAVPDFLFHAFRQADRSRGGAEMSALDVLREAEKEVEGEFAEQPLIRARIQESIGLTYQSLGRDDLAGQTLKSAMESYGNVPGNEEAVKRLASPVISALRSSGAAVTSVDLSERDWREREAKLGKDHPDTHAARLNHCRSLLEVAFWDDTVRADYLGRVESYLDEVLDATHLFPQAKVIDYEAVKAQHAAGSGDHASALAFWDVELKRIFLSGAAGTEARFWPGSFHVAALRRNGRLEDAAAAAESLVLHCRKFYGLTHGNTVTATRSLSIVYGMMHLDSGGYLACRQITPDPGEEVDPVFVERLKVLADWSDQLKIATDERTRLRGVIRTIKSGKPEIRDLTRVAAERPEVLFWLAELCWAEDHRAEALALAEKACAISLSTYGSRHPLAIVRSNRLSGMRLEAGLPGQVEADLSARLEELGSNLTWVDGLSLDLAMDLAHHYSRKEADAAAEPIARRVAALKREQRCAGLPFLERYYDILKASALRKKDARWLVLLYEEIVPMFVEVLGEGHWATAQRKMRHADALVGSGKPAEALEKVDTFLAGNAEWKLPVVHWWITRGRALAALDRNEEAEAAYQTAWTECLRLGFGKPSPDPSANTAARRTAENHALLCAKLGRKEDQQKWERLRDSIRIP